MSEYFVPNLTEIDYSRIAVCSRVLIDGDGGCRKTSLLAPTIADKIKGKVLSIDDFLGEPGRPYWDQVDYQRLHREITGDAANVVIEGSCVLKVLATMNVQFDYHIFTKLILDENTFNEWQFEQYLSETVPLPKAELNRNISEYYREFRPFDHCDLIIERHISLRPTCQ